MKTLKFRATLADLILKGEKTVTWRLFDDKNLQTGDNIELLIWETKKPFSKAVIEEVKEKTLDQITDIDCVGHEIYANHDEMLETYRKYYGNKVDENTVVKMIKFRLL